MSSQYPYPYPQQQFPQQQQPPGGSMAPSGPGDSLNLPQPAPHDVYVPIQQVVPGNDLAVLASQQLTNIAANRDPIQLGVKVPEGSLDYPLAMYNAKTRTVKPAKDKEEKQKLEGQGFSDQPFPAEDPNAATLEALQALQTIFNKAGDAIQKLITTVQQQQNQMQAAGAILGAGQQPGQAQQQQPPQQWDQSQYPYPQGTGD